jgi:hypothetical protein
MTAHVPCHRMCLPLQSEWRATPSNLLIHAVHPRLEASAHFAYRKRQWDEGVRLGQQLFACFRGIDFASPRREHHALPVGRGSSRAFALGVAFDRVVALHAGRRRCAAESNDDRDDVDIDLEQVEVARHLTQFLTLAGNLF